MTLKGYRKFKEKLICGLKNDLRNLFNFYARSRKSKSFNFHVLLLCKAYNVVDEEVQKNYVP